MRSLQLDSMMKTVTPADADLKKLITGDPAKKAEVDKAASAVACYEYLCQAKKSKKPLPDSDKCKVDYKNPADPCSDLKGKKEAMDKAMLNAAEAQNEGDLAMDILSAYKSKTAKDVYDKLQLQIKDLEAKLLLAPAESPAVSKANGKGEMTKEDMERNWMAFRFNSKSSSMSATKSSTSYKAAAKLSIGIPSLGLGLNVGGETSYSESKEDFNQRIKQSDVSVSAKLLRVTINRNWFRPSVFDISSLQMVCIAGRREERREG